MNELLMLVAAIGILSLFVAAYLALRIFRHPTGTPKMVEISEAIREGAEAFLKRQYVTIAVLSIFVAALIYFGYGYLGQQKAAETTAISFIFGAVSSGIAGIVGMYVAVKANIKAAAGASKSLPDALDMALNGGAVTGIVIVALSLIGITALYELFGADAQETPFLIVGYGFGASFVALFAQLGGGIYTKAADVGADLVGKVEAGIPEDDPRNPAVIADLVGDNVGDCAGRGADLFESTAAENIGAMILGVALFPVFGAAGVVFPLVARSFGLIASIVGVISVKAREDEHPMDALNRGYYVALILATLLFLVATMWLLGNIWFFYAGFVGIVTSLVFVYITQYYTDGRYRPVKDIVKSSYTGPATNIITGLSVAMETTGATVVVISGALIASYWLGTMSGVPGGGLYGTAMATMGMLATAAYVLAMDTFGPITDNAGGIVTMANAPEAIRRRTDQLDSVGNTTKALTKGYAIGSAALAAFLLFSAYMSEVAKLSGKAFEVVNLAKVDVFVGALLGAMLMFFFTGLVMRGVGKTAEDMIAEVRRQFKDKRIMAGKIKPNYARCVDITAKGALKNMVVPGLLAVGFPLVVGVLLKAEAVAALLMVGTIAGVLLATMMNNGGGAWDNAKKYLEEHGHKGTDAHKAAVVGDTVGDPFKDAAGPSLHVVIKLLNTVTLVLVPLFL